MSRDRSLRRLVELTVSWRRRTVSQSVNWFAGCIIKHEKMDRNHVSNDYLISDGVRPKVKS